MGRGGFLGSVLNSMAREALRQPRRAEAEQRRQHRAHIQYQRQLERMQKIQNKEEKQRYLQQRLEEAEDKNTELVEWIDNLKGILNHTLPIDDTIKFDTLRIKEEFKPAPIPKELSACPNPPQKEHYVYKVKPLGFFEKAFGKKERHRRELEEADSRYEAARLSYEQGEKERELKLDQFLIEQERSRQSFMLKVQQRNEEVDEFEASYRNGDYQTIIAYNSMVLERSEYPDGFPQEFRLGYAINSKQLVIDYDLPSFDIVPGEAEFKYVKAKDSIESKARKATEIKELYQDVVAAVALRTLHEVFEADQSGHINVAVFNGFVYASDHSTGRPVHPCIFSVRVTRERFSDIDLSKVDKRVCLRSLGAQVSNQPQALQAIKPLVEFNMVDKRFVEQGDVISELDSRPNLMDLNPYEFEALVSNLFGKMGLETKLTRSAKDGGVDAVAFDTRPIIGGKIVIQAKRYKNTVGVSAVRDLFGTMQHEGANKGILVTTSGYGPDAYDFSKDKPIELIDGGGLLYLLDQVGIKAKIIFPEDGI
jgi:restriction system protein